MHATAAMLLCHRSVFLCSACASWALTGAAGRRAQEFMRALQCFLMEFWDMSTRGLEAYLPPVALGGLQGGWCVELPQRTRICHLRWCALKPHRRC